MPGRKKVVTSLTEVGHGCVDCAAYDFPMRKQPCAGCKNWSEWTPSQKYLDRMALNARMELEITRRKGK